jgi:hypothetical protein
MNNELKAEKSVKTRKDVAEFWNIPHIISTDNVNAWEISFSALCIATIMLDNQQSTMLSLKEQKRELIAQLEESESECMMYYDALEKIAKKYSLDISDYLG